jgi:hypothetical protein
VRARRNKMDNVVQFPVKHKDEVDAEIELHRIRLMSLYADMEHTIKEINYTKQVIQMLEKGSK